MGLVDARFGAFVAVATLLILAPGPDMALVTRNALLAGRRVASFTALGVGMGSVVWALASVLGLAVLLEKSLVIFTLCKVLGAAYLAYLGVRSLIVSYRGTGYAAEVTSATRMRPHGERAALRQGLLGNLLNPKAAVIFVTVFPQFISPGDSPSRLLLMLLAFELILLCWLNLYAYLVSRAGRSRVGQRAGAILHGVTGVVLLALGARLVFEGQ